MKLDVNKKRSSKVAIPTRDNQVNHSAGTCFLLKPRTMAFILPFLAVLVFEQLASGSNSCLSKTLCSMCVLSKTATAIFAGLAGMAVQNIFSRRMRKHIS